MPHTGGEAFSRTSRWRPLGKVCCLLAVCSLAEGVAVAQDMRAPVRTPHRLISKYVWSYKELRERQIVMQKRDYSCGAATLATIARYYWGDDVGETRFLDLLPKMKLTPEQMKGIVEEGLSLTDLRDLAEMADYLAEMRKPTFSELAQVKIPVIVGIVVNKHKHFAVFRGTDGAWVYLADPIRGNVRTPIPVFIEQWQKPDPAHPEQGNLLALIKPDAEMKEFNPMAIRQDEVDRGVLNDFTMNKNALTPVIPNPVRINN
jgi:predicted double-glycine peptidase